MKISEAKQIMTNAKMNQAEKAAFLCFYHYKETGETEFDMKGIQKLFSDAGYSKINDSRVRKALISEKKMRLIAGMNSTLEFIPATLEEFETDYSGNWEDTVTVISDSEMIDEVKFCGKRQFLDKLIKQINSTYKNNCYDACAVLLRRVFEILLVLSYQHLGIDVEIKKPTGEYFMLEGIVSNAKNNRTLNIPVRIANGFDSIRQAGNFSAHNITYTASKKDIDDIKSNYRLMMEELYNKAGLL